MPTTPPVEKTPREILSEIISDEEIEHGLKMMAIPIDFAQLVAGGVLKKRGGRWQVLDWARLPEHARAKVQSVGSNRKTGVNCVTFCREYPRSRSKG